MSQRLYRQKIRKATSPMMAARLGRDRKQKLRREWEATKVGVMRAAVLAKFAYAPIELATIRSLRKA